MTTDRPDSHDRNPPAPAPAQSAAPPNAPAQSDPDPSEPLPGEGWLGWLGRQVGYVRQALRTDVGGEKVVFRKDSVREATHPTDPAFKLRRTVVDEVIRKRADQAGPDPAQLEGPDSPTGGTEG